MSILGTGQIITLDRTKYTNIVEALVAALKDESRWVRIAAARVLGTIKDPRVVEPLIAVINDADRGVQGAAAAALGDTRDPRAGGVLLEVLRRKDTLLIVYAYRFFIWRGEPGSEDTLIEVFENYNNRDFDLNKVVTKKDMATAFLNSSNPRLEKAGREWATSANYWIHHMPGSSVKWGSGR